MAEAAALANNGCTNEETYYPIIRNLLQRLLTLRSLPFDVRVGTTHKRAGEKGIDRPDFVLLDGGDFVVAFGEVKLPSAEIEEIAVSTDRENQIGRYLAQTGVVLISNVRSFGLLVCNPDFSRDPSEPVPPEKRRLLSLVDFYDSEQRLKKNQPRALSDRREILELLETAVTEFSSIADPSSLAMILARQARKARENLPAEFSSLKPLLDDYRDALGLTFDPQSQKSRDFFTSSLIQTAFYTLFSAWTLWHRANDGTEFEWDRIDKYLKLPFLGKLFYEFRHPDRLAELGLAPHLDRANATLSRVDRTLFFSHFTYATLDDDESNIAAITYFYEPFLEAFDPDLRKSLGVWFTPPAIVRYQVRKIHDLLRSHLGCRRGIADERVVVLDPCCGTGAYLLEAVRCIAADLKERGEEATLGTELLDALMHRVFGMELLTAPFVIAQLQLYLLLDDLGVNPGPNQRLGIYLTNALTGWSETDQVKLNFPELQDEHDSAQETKQNARIIVMLGNPPYDRFAGVATDEEADLVDHYKGISRAPKRGPKGEIVLGSAGKPVMVQRGKSRLYLEWGVQKQLLDDLYVRFFRLAEERIGVRAEYGIISFISNYSFLGGRSHPIMRESLASNFHEVWIDNLNGDKYRTGKMIPQGLPGEATADQSIFTTDRDARGIQPGTCVSTFLKKHGAPTDANQTPIHYRDFWGKADAKRQAVLDSLEMDTWSANKKKSAASTPEGPRNYETFFPAAANGWRFSPRGVGACDESWPSLDQLFPVSFQGVNPNRGIDDSLIDFDTDKLRERMRYYFESESFESVRERYPVLTEQRARYDPKSTWTSLRNRTHFDPLKIVPYLLFPLDQRWIYYETEAKLLNERRPEFWENLRDNEFLVAVPEPRQASEILPLLSQTLVDLHVHDRGSVCFPRDSRAGNLLSERVANIAEPAWKVLKSEWKLPGDRATEVARSLVGDLFRCVLAVLYSPGFQDEHHGALAEGWAAVPISKSRKTFSRLVKLGDDFATLLNPNCEPNGVLRRVLGNRRSKALGVLRKDDGRAIQDTDLVVEIPYFGGAKGRWNPRDYLPEECPHPAWGARTGDLYIAEGVRFDHVPEGVWSFQIGGYPVLKKWLGYRQASRRRSEPLSIRERRHLRSMIQRIAAVLALGDVADSLYEQSVADAFTAAELGLT